MVGERSNKKYISTIEDKKQIIHKERSLKKDHGKADKNKCI